MFSRRFLMNIVKVSCLVGAAVLPSASVEAQVDAAARSECAGRESGVLCLDDLLRFVDVGSVNLSPDGQWLAYWDGSQEQPARIRIVNLVTRESLEASPHGVPTGGVGYWSPNGRYLAFYASQGGKYLLAIWDSSSRQASLLDNAEFANRSRAESGRITWFSDSRRIIIPVRSDRRAENPNGARAPAPAAQSRAPVPLRVLSANVDPADRSRPIAENGLPAPPPCCDLGVVDVRTGRTDHVVRNIELGWFHSPSPDGRRIAYSTLSRHDVATQQNLYDLNILDLATGRARVLVRDLRMHDGGRHVAWSPNGRTLALLALRSELSADEVGSRDRLGPARMQLIALDTGAIREFTAPNMPMLWGRTDPIWNPDSRRLYAVSVDRRQLWELDAGSGRGRAVLLPSGIEEITVGRPDESGTSRSAAVALRAADDIRALGRLDFRAGSLTSLEAFRDAAVRGGFDTNASGQLAYIGAPPGHPAAIWLLRPGRSAPERLVNPNSDIERARLGTIRRLTWTAQEGHALAGTLLLPQGYRAGDRVPLMVMVYGGAFGSNAVNTFGVHQYDGPVAADNGQMFATRGYAFLYPDIPEHLGTPALDNVAAVTGAVDAAIAGGFVDPERIAIMGFSHGSYSVQWVITHTTRFRAAIISGVGDPDLVAHYTRMRSNGSSAERHVETGQGLMGGPPWQYPDRYRDNSPIYRFDRIETPVLIQQGADDEITPVTGANSVFVALRRLGKPVEYRLYQGEGHGFRRPDNLRDIWASRFRFLADNLDLALDDDGRVIMENGRARSRGSARQASSR